MQDPKKGDYSKEYSENKLKDINKWLNFFYIMMLLE